MQINQKPEIKPEPVLLNWEDVVQEEGVYQKKVWQEGDPYNTYFVVLSNAANDHRDNQPPTIVLYVSHDKLEVANLACWETPDREFVRVENPHIALNITSFKAK